MDGQTAMNVLVTAGAGCIGSHACKALARAGHTPITYDNLVHGHHRAVKWGPRAIGDLSDRGRLDAVIAEYRPQAVMHFAAYIDVGESVVDPGKYYRHIVAGSLTLLEAIRDHGIETMIFSSTCATYGIPEDVPISEAHPQRPINPYGASTLDLPNLPPSTVREPIPEALVNGASAARHVPCFALPAGPWGTGHPRLPIQSQVGVD